MRSRHPAELVKTYEQLTPTQQLGVEVLVARYRLGEHVWTFDSKLTPQFVLLEQAGWVYLMGGVTEKTFRAGFTRAASKKLFFDSTFVSPLEQENITLTDQNEMLRRLKFGID